VESTLIIADHKFPWIFAVMHNQPCGFGRVWNPEGQPDPKRFAGAQFIRQPVRWLSILWDGCGACWVAVPGLILKFDTSISGTLANSLGVAGDFDDGDPRVAARSGRTGKLRREFRGRCVEGRDTPVIETFPVAGSEGAARHGEADHWKNYGVSGDENTQEARQADGRIPAAAKRGDGNANEKDEHEKDRGEKEQVG